MHKMHKDMIDKKLNHNKPNHNSFDISKLPSHKTRFLYNNGHKLKKQKIKYSSNKNRFKPAPYLYIS